MVSVNKPEAGNEVMPKVMPGITAELVPPAVIVPSTGASGLPPIGVNTEVTWPLELTDTRYVPWVGSKGCPEELLIQLAGRLVPFGPGFTDAVGVPIKTLSTADGLFCSAVVNFVVSTVRWL